MSGVDTISSPAKAAPEFKATAGYIVVSTDWNPARDPWNAWNLLTLKAARAVLAYWERWTPAAGKVIVRVETTYTAIEGGGDD